MHMKTNVFEGKDYDGIFFYPSVEDDEVQMNFSFWKYSGDYADKESIEDTELGNKYFVAFLDRNDEGDLRKDVFEAIFADPLVYLEGLFGLNLFGVVCRKTSNSALWFQNFLKDADKLFLKHHG